MTNVSLYNFPEFILQTKETGLKIEPKVSENWNMEEIEWTLETCSDSDWAGDKDNRRSVTGHVLFLFGVPISWRSSQQKSASLSSSEAEHCAMSESVKETIFVARSLEALGIKVQKPMKIRVDNIGAIFMAENTTASPRTKHMDVRANFAHEFIDEKNGECICEFVKSEDNKADVFTKNVNKETMDKHTNFLGKEDEINNNSFQFQEGCQNG